LTDWEFLELKWFEGRSFHLKCDGKENTVTIIKTNGNYVFGGYTAAKWNSIGTYINDASAFIFSLRRNSVSNNYKLMLNGAQSLYAIAGYPQYGPNFGAGHDFHIYDKSNINTGSYSYFCKTCPSGMSYSSVSNAFLAGALTGWLTTEIEVYQIQ
jgi:hypothetical protein